ncbi:MAG: UvrY/SirA/GacA family response regulator transcription factor [Gammaproteobacteria bacterium]|nr:UvrY/SirA/GacA family response regulator transcription factor [Gammaproteobacteria bacterium]
MIRVLIVDDHRLVRTGIARVLEDVKGIEVAGCAESGEEALERIRQAPPDVVLMDIRMPGIGGMEATRRALRLEPDLKIVATTVYDDEPFPGQMFDAGAIGYVTKDADPRELISAIRKAQVGQRYLSSDVAQHMALRSYETQEVSPFTSLSGREMQIATMVVSCRKVQEISECLCLSPKTVNSYRYRIFEKLNISSDVELTLLAMKHGMLDPHTVVDHP